MEELYSYKEKTLQKNKAGQQNTTTQQQQQKEIIICIPTLHRGSRFNFKNRGRV